MLLVVILFDPLVSFSLFEFCLFLKASICEQRNESTKQPLNSSDLARTIDRAMRKKKENNGGRASTYRCHVVRPLTLTPIIFCSRLRYTRGLVRSARHTSWRRRPKTRGSTPCRERWRFRLTLWTVRIIRPYGTT